MPLTVTVNDELLELRLIEPMSAALAAPITLTLPFEQRQKSRLRTRLDNGQEVGLFLPRGAVLRHGDLLCAANGLMVEVQAALETVSTAHATDSLLLARAAYHLGNRHAALQLGSGWLRYLHDHVLDDMVRDLGLEVMCEQASFEPETGAYGGGGHHHQHA